MSQKDGFAAGFLAGSFVGGVLGGVLGALLASRINNQASETEAPILANQSETKAEKSKKRQMEASNEPRIEMARRSLEDKIAQLNQTIDEVRLSLGNVNGNVSSEKGENRGETDSPSGSMLRDNS
jgi:gas vesicle protein